MVDFGIKNLAGALFSQKKGGLASQRNGGGSLATAAPQWQQRGGKLDGGAVAAPVFGRAMGGVLRPLNITPDDKPSMKIAGATPPAGTTP